MKEREKLIKKKTLKEMLIVDCIFVIVIFCLAFVGQFFNDNISVTHQVLSILIILIVIIIANVYLWFILNSVNKDKLKWQESSLLVEENFLENRLYEIMPRRDREDIPPYIQIFQKAGYKFYARYDGKENVEISVDKEHIMSFLENINKMDFSSYYIIK